MNLKNLFVKLFVAFMVLGINPANAQKEANRLYFPSKDIKEICMKPVSPEVFVGIPRDLYIVEDNLLILDSYEGKHLTLVDLKRPFKERRIGSQGQGPNEFLRINELSYNSEMKLLRVFDEYARRQSSYSVAGRNVVFNDANLYVLYLGLSKAYLEKKGHPCYILKFDWEGNFAGGYKSDVLLQCFAVDEVNRKIYAVTSARGDDESMLVECGLP